MEIIILCAWSIWLTRNSIIFNNVHPSLYRWRAIFMTELKWLKFRATRKKYASFSSWVDRFLDFLFHNSLIHITLYFYFKWKKNTQQSPTVSEKKLFY
jgi:hypothetical protein